MSAERPAVRLLLVEDDAVDRLACRRALAQHPDYRFELIEAETARQGIQLALARAPDLVLLDYHLPDLNGLEFLLELKDETGEMPVPVMMLTGSDNVAVAVEAMRHGARDYLVKDREQNHLKLLPAVIERVLREQRLQAEKRAAEAKYRTLVEQVPAITYIAALDVPGKLLYISPQVRTLGFSPEQWLADPDGLLKQVVPEDRAAVRAAFARSYETGEPLRCEYRVRTASGETRWCLDEAVVVRDERGAPLFLQGVLVDITEDKRVQQELEYHRRRLEDLVASRTAQLERQTELLKAANANLGKEIEERRRAEAAARRYAAEVEDLYNQAPCGYHSLDANGVIVRVNDTELRWLGYTREEVIGRRFTDFLTPQGIKTFEENFPRFKERGEVHDLEFELLRKDGSILPVQLSATAVRDSTGKLLMSRTTLFDISARRRAEEALRASESRFRLLLESAGEGIYGLDTEGRCMFVNDAALAMLGYAREELIGRDTHSLIHHTRADGTPYAVADCRIYDAFRTGESCRGCIELLWRKDGTSFPAEYSAQPIRQDGRVTGAVLVFRDVTEAQALAHRLSYQATHDALTGLINRQEFERRLERVLAEARREGSEHALCYLDLDQFKVVNDSCGHAAGDQLLRELSTRLQERLRSRDSLARLGGDEFGVLLEHCPLEQALRVAHELRVAVGDFRFVWEGQVFTIGVSVGVVGLSAATPDLAAALSAADAACYTAKEKGRNRVHVYHDDDVELVERRTQMHWVARLTQALDEDRFELLYQPIAPLGAPPGARPYYEILLRLTGEDGRPVEPGVFMPAAERYNLMPAIDRWVLRHALADLAARHRAAPAPARPIYAVNLSAASLNDPALAGFIRDLLVAHGVPPASLCLEIAERAAIANLASARQLIGELRQLGCLFSLDDFGTGMHSFVHLKTLAVDYLKIDGNFIRRLAEDRIGHAMAEAINRVAHVMAIQTVAECAESPKVLALLRELGVDHAQGYAIMPPRPLAELDAVGAARVPIDTPA